MVKQDIDGLIKGWKVRMDMDLILTLLEKRSNGDKINIPKGFEANFSNPKTKDEKAIQKLIQEYRSNLILKLEEDLFSQKTRNNKANEALKTKVTKKAQNDLDVSKRQIERIKKRLEKIKDTKPRENDSRIYAYDYAPVIVLEKGERVLKLMRYHLRPPTMKEDFDRKYPGCYNARRDSLLGFWKNQFGVKHGLLVVTSFFENVLLHDLEQRKLKKGEEETNVVIEFKPEGMDYMLVPVIWDYWGTTKDGFNSFALITDEPPKEVLATGHDRCPIFLSESRIDDWLTPKGKSPEELFEILDDRERPLYKHSLAG